MRFEKPDFEVVKVHLYRGVSAYNDEDYLRYLHQVVEELGWEEFHFVGHSMGGGLGTVFCAAFKGVKSLTVVEGLGYLGRGEDEFDRR